MRFSVAAIVSIALLSNWSPAMAQDLDAKAIVRVEVRGQTEKGPYVRIGTGFLIGQSDYVLTARHLVRSDSPVVKDEITGQPRFSIALAIRDGTGLLRDRRDAFVFRENVDWDVALLAVQGKELPQGLQTCPDEQPSGAADILVRGFPVRVEGNLDREDGEGLENGHGLLAEQRANDKGRFRFAVSPRRL